MKAFTDISQSRKLAEILPLESADSYYSWHDECYYIVNKDCPYPYSLKEKIPCWSLAALLKILPIEAYIEIDNVCCTLDISRDTLGKWFVSYHNKSYGSSLVTCSNKELIDACVEIILKLKEKNLI